ncbi:NUDIX domain-containing protein [uncultured Microbacterium sp.]|uniref:NUDIX hydrolase n=1 Tax=uncultured Microbacterium sp. TaxID=191216 RepID=UPI0025FD79DD|nr:NUDIX domain-containing protein [uncultured Microbacterium sp.]
MTETAVYAAGGVLWRVVDDVLHVLLIHRTKYRDITLPKGKVDPGETLAETAVREIREETGISVALGAPVGVSRYRLPSKRTKIVHYWSAKATDGAIRRSSFVPNREIAGIEWMPLRKARKALSYPVDLEILDAFVALVEHEGIDTFPIILLRHAKALPRDGWKGADAARGLAARGTNQAKAIVGPLLAFGPKRIVSSPAVRCVSTITPLAAAIEREPELTPLISQDAWDDGTADVRAVIGERVRARKPVVVCSHRPLLPDLLAETALATATVRGSYVTSASELEPAAFSVLHVSRTHPGSGIIAIETHAPQV